MLNDQIKNMLKETERLLESVRKERNSVINSIENLVKQTYQGCSSSQHGQYVGIKMYGSMASGLAIEQSDVDLAVVGLDLQGDKDIQIREMRRLCDQLDCFMKSKLTSLKFIETASVPVIKLQVDLQKVYQRISKHQGPGLRSQDSNLSEIEDSMRHLGIDITFEDCSKQSYMAPYRINHGISCISSIQELCINQPTLKPIVLVLKKILQLHNLNQPYLGGLNSYSLVIMTYAYLRWFGTPSTSKNLRELLNYYGNFFNPSKTIVSTNGLNSDQSHQCLPDPVTVIDPLNEKNNITRSSFRIRDIQQIFKEGYNMLINNEELFKQQMRKSSQT